VVTATSFPPREPTRAARDKARTLDEIRSVLQTAAFNFLRIVRQENPGLKLRSLLFGIWEHRQEVSGTVATEEGLIFYRQEEGTTGYSVEAGDPIAMLKEYILWGRRGRWYGSEPDPAFAEVNGLLLRARERGVLKPFDGTLNQLCLDVLRQMDGAGSFGTGVYRDAVIVGVCGSLGADSLRGFLDGAKHVNPRQAIQWLRREIKRRVAGN
jgi:hypothetical protein